MYIALYINCKLNEQLSSMSMSFASTKWIDGLVLNVFMCMGGFQLWICCYFSRFSLLATKKRSTLNATNAVFRWIWHKKTDEILYCVCVIFFWFCREIFDSKWRVCKSKLTDFVSVIRHKNKNSGLILDFQVINNKKFDRKLKKQ